jgi:hypothetical protein
MATTPPSEDPQVPGNYPGTVQNPTQVPAPVNPVTDPEVPALPNDVDPNFITNPEPVNNTIDPEVPQPEENFPRKKRFDAEPVVPVTNPEVPQPQDFGSEPPTGFPPAQDFGSDPQIGLPPAQDFGSEPPIVVPDAQDFGTDPQVPDAQDFGSEPPIGLPPPQDFGSDPQIVVPAAQDFGSEPPIDLPQALPSTGPAANNTGFDDFYGDQTYTVNYTGTADTVPAGNTGFDDFYGDQTYTANFTGTADARPVIPATNSQVPDLFSSISSLLSSLFGIRPTVVSPAANPQVAQAFPVPAPTVFTPTPIPPAANPQVPLAQDFGSEPRIVVPLAQDFGSDPQIGLPPPQDFGSEPPIVVPLAQDFGSDPQIGLPPPQDFGSEPPIVIPDAQDYGSDPQIGLPPPQDFGSEPPIVVPPAQDYGSDPQIGLPPPQDFGGRKKADPDIVDSPTEPAVQAQAENRIDGPVNQALLQQSNPAVATDYRSYIVDTQNKIVEQQTRELEATQGYPASENQIAVINGEAFGTATIAANVRFKNQVESADAAQSVPANTPPPTVAPADVNVPALPNDVDPNFITNTAPVDNTIEPQAAQVDEALVAARAIDPNFIPLNDVSATTNPQVPSSANTRVENVNQSEFAQKDPTVAQQYNDFKNETAAQLTTQRIAEREAVEGGPISVSEQVQIAARAEIDATADANFRYQDQIEAAGAATVVPADTPPPTVIPPAQDFGTDPQVPLAQDFGSEPPIVVPAAQDFGTDPQVPLAQDFGQDPPIVVPAAQDFGTDPQVPLAQDFGSEPPIVVPDAQDFGVDPQVPLAQDFGSEPPLPAPAPPSPSPYERFLAEEAAATTAAEAEATARFNAQFDNGGNIIGSSADPQVPAAQDFGSEPPIGAPPPQDFGSDPQIGLPPAQDFGSEPPIVVPDAQDFGVDPQVPDAQDFGSEPPILVPDAQDFGVDPQAQDFGTDADFNIGEFQSEPVDIPTIETGYDDFYGNEADVGEFQSEPVDIPTIETGYDDFYGNEEDVGEFQAEPGIVGSDDTGFGDFSDTGGGDGGDFFGSIFGSVKKSAGAVSGGSDPVAGLFDSIFGGSSPKANPKTTVSPQQAAANREKAAKALAKQQSIINRQRKQANDGDWRVKLRLAGNSNYLYNAFNPGILKPLEVTDGVIFPYTPTITTAYQAKYNAYELTHSNYKGYFYQGSSVGDITINATFTAQDTSEANYLLAVIHFFRSVTKMFYGQDDAALRGAPPPLVFLQGLGEYQFNLHPCVVSNFNYTMPNDVDYIRALSPNNNGTNLTNRRSLQSGVTPFVNPSSSRLQNAGLPLGGITTPAAPPTLGTNSPTYVPTKMEIQITLLAIQTRSQVSNQFSLKQFANGDLIRGGFW